MIHAELLAERANRRPDSYRLDSENGHATQTNCWDHFSPKLAKQVQSHSKPFMHVLEPRQLRDLPQETVTWTPRHTFSAEYQTCYCIHSINDVPVLTPYMQKLSIPVAIADLTTWPAFKELREAPVTIGRKRALMILANDTSRTAHRAVINTVYETMRHKTVMDGIDTDIKDSSDIAGKFERLDKPTRFPATLPTAVSCCPAGSRFSFMVVILPPRGGAIAMVPYWSASYWLRLTTPQRGEVLALTGKKLQVSAPRITIYFTGSANGVGFERRKGIVCAESGRNGSYGDIGPGLHRSGHLAGVGSAGTIGSMCAGVDARPWAHGPCSCPRLGGVQRWRRPAWGENLAGGGAYTRPATALVHGMRLCRRLDSGPINPVSVWLRNATAHLVVLSDWVFSIVGGIAATGVLMLAVRSALTRQHRGPATGAAALASPSFLSSYRATLMLYTCVAILGVDFPVFPRRFAKVEGYGYGLMDVGVGSFVLANAVVSREARGLPSRPRAETLHAVAPLVALGIVRFAMVKASGYQHVETEYGTHWNFFFTLASVVLLNGLLPLPVTWAPVVGTAVLTGHQLLLSATSLGETLLSEQRGPGWLSRNKEGMGSIPGYWALFLLGQGLGRYLLSPSGRRPDNPRNEKTQMGVGPTPGSGLANTLFEASGNARSDSTLPLKNPLEPVQRQASQHPHGLETSGDRDETRRELIGGEGECRGAGSAPGDAPALALGDHSRHVALDVLLWCLLAAVARFVQPVCRRSCNMAYVLWILALNLQVLLIFCWVEVCVPPVAAPVLLTAMNQHLLLVFLAANLMTGGINVALNTISCGTSLALLVLLGYLTILASLSLVLDRGSTRVGPAPLRHKKL
eukprot:jgi/Mesvir1/6527/Mv16791-RA.1